jgi:tetratricopeptide (TPR) repeat protein
LTSEDLVIETLTLIIDEKWDDISPFLAKENPKTKAIILKKLKTKKELNELTHFFIYASGYSPDNTKSFSAVEMDNKHDLVVVSALINGQWKIENLIFGGLEMIAAEKDTCAEIALKFQEQNLLEALKRIEKAESIYCLSADLAYFKGHYHFSVKQTAKAIEAFIEASELDPDWFEPYYYLGLIHHTLDEIPKAKTYYQKALSFEPNYILALNNLGVIYEREKDLAKAIECYEKCLKIEPKFEGAAENLQRLKNV